jgi:trehalose/maltose hydrolase-like predicted phosphorylase
MTPDEDAPNPRLIPGLSPNGSDLRVWRTELDDDRVALAASDHLVRHLPPAVEGTEAANHTWTVELNPGDQVVLERVRSAVRDPSTADAAARARATIEQAEELGADSLFQLHADAWRERWDASDIQLIGDPTAQQGLRFSIYHLISAADPTDEHVSIGARSLTGDAYMGHVFWDTEIFVLPFLIHTWPEAARACLMFRYHTLPAARAKAREKGFRGALYPWESAVDGREATPAFVINQDGHVVPIWNAEREIHIVADVAYAVWQYWDATGDDDFIRSAGAEIILETARFWASRAQQEEDGRYHIRAVIGPDEYHEDVDDNAYTNVMAQWTLERALDLSQQTEPEWQAWWSELSKRLEITTHELADWQMVADGIAIDYDPAGQVIEQFAGYFELTPVFPSNLSTGRAPMDIVLGREATQSSQVHKQADAIMLVWLLPERMSPEAMKATFEYYEPRCGHGSSLSPGAHALVAAQVGDVALAERYFRQAINIDLEDVFGNAAQGIHIAAAGGLWQAAVFGFAGIRFTSKGLEVNPRLPPSWETLTIPLQWRRRHLVVTIDATLGSVLVELQQGPAMTVAVGNRVYPLEEGQPVQAAVPTR